MLRGIVLTVSLGWMRVPNKGVDFGNLTLDEHIFSQDQG